MNYYFIPKGTVCHMQVFDSCGNKAFSADYKTRKDRILNCNDVSSIYDAVDDTDIDDISCILFKDGKIVLDGEEMDKLLLVQKAYIDISSMGIVS